jgi:soluble lytic murein transglycosylase-like protein
MKKFPLFCLLALVCASPALAQNGYRYDNFDTPNGVRVADVPTRSALPPSATVRKTAHVNSVTEGLTTSRPAPLLYTLPRGMGMAASRSLDGFTTGDARIDSYIVEAGARNGVDPVLLYATMHQESSFKQGAVSPKGARGLMQLMPGTARRFGVTDIFNPRQNIEGGARYMRFLLDSFDGDVSLALAGYNAGEGAVLKYGRQIPPYRETQEYVRRITRRYALMRDPQTARNARVATPSQVAEVQTEHSAPLTIYERNVYAVRLPDGRLQLVNQ